MSPNREPRWLSKEPVKTANAEFKEALKNDPFVGAVAVNALANFVKATEEIRKAPRSKVTPEAATEQITTRLTQVCDRAQEAHDDTYVQIFTAQLAGWESAARTIQGEATPQQEPTQTAGKNMSDSKSDPKTR